MMEELLKTGAKLALVLLAGWVVLAGLGLTTMPGTKKQAVQRARHRRAKGNTWAQAVAYAPAAEDSLAFPAAPVM